MRVHSTTLISKNKRAKDALAVQPQQRPETAAAVVTLAPNLGSLVQSKCSILGLKFGISVVQGLRKGDRLHCRHQLLHTSHGGHITR